MILHLPHRLASEIVLELNNHCAALFHLIYAFAYHLEASVLYDCEVTIQTFFDHDLLLYKTMLHCKNITKNKYI